MASEVDPDLKKLLSRKLRQICYMWAPRTEALRAAKVGWGKYVCADCLETCPRKEVAIDHIEPVVPVTGWVNWDDEINRLFCKKEGFQILCKPCHKIKTNKENAERRIHRKAAKPVLK